MISTHNHALVLNVSMGFSHVWCDPLGDMQLHHQILHTQALLPDWLVVSSAPLFLSVCSITINVKLWWKCQYLLGLEVTTMIHVNNLHSINSSKHNNNSKWTYRFHEANDQQLLPWQSGNYQLLINTHQFQLLQITKFNLGLRYIIVLTA